VGWARQARHEVCMSSTWHVYVEVGAHSVSIDTQEILSVRGISHLCRGRDTQVTIARLLDYNTRLHM